MMRLLILAAGALLFAAAPVGAGYVGSTTCLDCHDDVGAFYAHSPHAAELGLTVPGSDVTSCEACHGPGEEHVDNGGDGGIRNADWFAALDEDASAGLCTQCHREQLADWHAGPHAGSGVTCMTCHTDQVHSGGELLAPTAFRNSAEFCLQCHTAQAADFRLPFRHRVLEGEIGCNDCHDPHGAPPAADPVDDRNVACLSCHVEMAGPFVFEHEGVADEACVECHRPHGSVNDKLLTQDGNSLCMQCHYEPEFPVINDVDHTSLLAGGRLCYGCHAQVHGSHFSPNFTE
jgi:DmsE family decaheme c-type cytochrome